MYFVYQAYYGRRFSSMWTAKSLGITMPPGETKDVITYIVEVCMSGLQKNTDALFPALNRVRG